MLSRTKRFRQQSLFPIVLSLPAFNSFSSYINIYFPPSLIFIHFQHELFRLRVRRSKTSRDAVGSFLSTLRKVLMIQELRRTWGPWITTNEEFAHLACSVFCIPSEYHLSNFMHSWFVAESIICVTSEINRSTPAPGKWILFLQPACIWRTFRTSCPPRYTHVFIYNKTKHVPVRKFHQHCTQFENLERELAWTRLNDSCVFPIEFTA